MSFVFDKDKFLKSVNNKEFLPDSFVAFRNKIGLSYDGGKTFISQKREVSLALALQGLRFGGCHS